MGVYTLNLDLTEKQRKLLMDIGVMGDNVKAQMGGFDRHSRVSWEFENTFKGLIDIGLARRATRHLAGGRSAQVWRLTLIGRKVYEQMTGLPAKDPTPDAPQEENKHDAKD